MIQDGEEEESQINMSEHNISAPASSHRWFYSMNCIQNTASTKESALSFGIQEVNDSSAIDFQRVYLEWEVISFR